MSSNGSVKTHTLNELIDLALQSPEKGAVNFNILRVVLLKIIEKLDFGKEKVEYKPPDIRTSILKFPEIKSHDRPFIKEHRETKLKIKAEKEPEWKMERIVPISKEKEVVEAAEKKKVPISKEKKVVEATEKKIEPISQDKKVVKAEEEKKVPISKEKEVVQAAEDREKLRTFEYADTTLELESQVQASEEDMQPDSTTPDEPEILKESDGPLQEDAVSSTISETVSPESEEDSKYEYETSEEEEDEGQYDDEAIADEEEKSKPRHKKKKKYPEKIKYSTEEKEEDSEKSKSSPKQKEEEQQSTDEEQTEKSFKTSMWHIWQIKKLSVKIDGFEETINTITQSVKELMKFKEERERRTKFEEGQKLESEYSSPYISREEFTNTVDDLGDALSRLFANQRHQKEECNTINQNILKELSLKASVEDLNRHSEPINSKFRTMGSALKNIQKLIKDVIYPETCGIAKCMTCGRKSHLPLRCIVKEGKKDTSEYKGAIESIITKNKEEKSEDLEFTNTSLRRIEKHPRENDQGVSQYAEQQERHLERPLFPDYLVELETLCDADKFSNEFAPLRRFAEIKRPNILHIPSLRPSKNPISISAMGSKNSQILMKN